MSAEIHPAVDGAVKAAKIKKQQAQIHRRKWATKVFAIRSGVLIGVGILAIILTATGLVAPGLAKVVVCAAGVLIAVWAGAWLQFMFAEEGGLLYVEE